MSERNMSSVEINDTPQSSSSAKSLSPLETNKRSRKKDRVPTPIHDLPPEEEEATSLYIKIFKSVQYTLLYFASSISLTLFVKHVATYSETKYPLTNLSGQMALNTIISGIASYFVLRYEIRNLTGAVTNKEIFAKLFRLKIFKKLVPFGCLSGLDYGMSNLSFLWITVTLYTMIKSSVPVFVLLVSFFAKMEKFTPSLLISVSLISFGIIVAAATSVDLNLLGMFLVLVASMLSGVRLVYVQYILQPKATQYQPVPQDDAPSSVTLEIVEGTPATAQLADYITDNDALRSHHKESRKDSGLELSSVQMFFYTAPIICLSVLPFALVFEGPKVYERILHISDVEQDPLLSRQNQMVWLLQVQFIGKIFMNICIGAFFAFFLNISEFLLLKETSGLTLTVLGIVKELLLISSSIFVFHDKLETINIVGYAISLVGIILFKINRYYKMKEKIHNEVLAKTAVVHNDEHAQ